MLDRRAHWSFDDGKNVQSRSIDEAFVVAGILKSNVADDQIEVGAAVLAQSMLDVVFVAQGELDFTSGRNGRRRGIVGRRPDWMMCLDSI